jgi:hypothetical protein
MSSYKTIEVEIDLEDFTDEELRDELAERLGGSGSGFEYNQSIRELYDLLHMGKDEQALAVLKVFVCDQLGRVL